MKTKTERVELVRRTIEKFKHLPNRTIARYILHHYGVMFDGDLEKIRSAIRYQVGQNGEDSKKRIGGKVIAKERCTIPPTWRIQRQVHTLPAGLWFIMPDTHVPFHEPKPIEAAVKYAQEQGVAGILFNGDLQDCAAVSFWPSTSKRDFDKETETMLDFLDFIEKEFPNRPKVWKPGNHEYRLPRYYGAKAPELIGMPLMAFDVVLGLEYRNIEMLQYKQIVMAGKLPILHGDEYKISTAVNPARGLFLKAQSWAACAHFHRTSEHTERRIDGTLLTTWSMGCLCDLSPDYNPYGAWNWGFMLVNVEKDGNFEVENRRILPNGKVV